MVGGLNKIDEYKDVHSEYIYTERLLAALVSLTASGGHAIERNTIFSAVPPIFSPSPPPHHHGSLEGINVVKHPSEYSYSEKSG
ncbi:hypothetical protein AgCh_032079 [Apium graveolens]